MDAIGALFSRGDAACGEENNWTVDLAQVEVADSAAVSMLLAWLRNAQRHGLRSLAFVNVPGNLRSLADLYGVADALPLSHAS